MRKNLFPLCGTLGLLFILAGCSVGYSCNVSQLRGATVYTNAGPFDAIFTADQCYLIVSTNATNAVSNVYLNVYANDGAGHLTFLRTGVLKPGRAGKMSLVNSGLALFVAGNTWIAQVSVAGLISGNFSPIYWDDSVSGLLYLVKARLSNLLVAAEEGNNTVVFLTISPFTLVGRVSVGQAPVGLAFSSDESLVYAVSQIAPLNFGWSNVCYAEYNPSVPYGVLQAISASTLTVVNTVPSGCSPVRVVNNGAYLFVTARADDTVRMVNPSDLSLQQVVSTGADPVGLAFGGGYLQVAASARFDGSPEGDLFYYASGQLYPEGSFPTGSFPREVSPSPDGNVVAITNFNSNTVQIN